MINFFLLPCLGNTIAVKLAFMAEIMAAIIAIEKAVEDWNWLWLETDSKLLIHAYSDPSSVAF